MDEPSWLTETDPEGMLNHLADQVVSTRKLRLLATACSRRIWHLLADECCRTAVGVAERYADGEVNSEELLRATVAARRVAGQLNGNAQDAADAVASSAEEDIRSYVMSVTFCASDAVWFQTREPYYAELAAQAHLVRDIFGNPFHPVTLDPAWLTSTAVALARGIYDGRAFDRMPILADALQDAGCDSDDVLTHCRDPQLIHVRGCWVVDLVLGPPYRPGRPSSSRLDARRRRRYTVCLSASPHRVMLSRVAENLYWISRYVERAEGLARLLDDAFSMELEAGTAPDGVGPLDNVLLMLSAREAYLKSRPAAADGPAEGREAVLRFLTFGRAAGASIRETVAGARENARGTQETLSGEAWSQLNKLHLSLNSPRAAARFSASPARFLDRVRRECVLFAALVDGTLPRTEAYHFLQVGRHLERVDVLSRVINVHCYASAAFVPAGVGSDVTFSATHWASLLRGTSAYEAYQKQARERIDPVGVVRYLLLEAEFPRSMRFAVGRCLESLRCIAGGGGGFGTDAERHLGRLDSELRYMDVDDLFRRGVDQFLVGVQETCAAVGKDVHTAYFRT